MDNLLWYHLGKKRGGGGSGGGGANKVDVFKEHKITGFAPNPDYKGAYASVYVFGVDGAEAFQLRVGENYTVVWDEEEHKVTAQDGSALISGSVLLGNASFLHPGLSGNNEPFLFGWTSKGCTFGSVDSTLEAHDVRIYQTVFENAESPSVALDFTNGNQIIRPSEDGKVLSNLTIEKPDTLIPDNIAEGIDIGGIIGTLAAGGGGSIKVAGGVFTHTGAGQIITHGLGEIPDLIVVDNLCATSQSGEASSVRQLVCFSTAYAQKTGQYIPSRYVWKVSGSIDPTHRGSRSFMDTTTSSSNGIIYNANAETFTLPKMDKTMNPYLWIAVAGLPAEE